MLDTAAAGVGRSGVHRPSLLLITATVFAGAASEGFDRLREAHLLRDVGVPQFAGYDPLVVRGAVDRGRGTLGWSIQPTGTMKATDSGTMARTLFGLSTLEIVAGLGFALQGRSRWPLSTLSGSLSLGPLARLSASLCDVAQTAASRTRASAQR